MRATTKDKRKGASDSHHQPLKEDRRTPKQLEGELSSEGAELQGKMRTAAKECVDYYHKYDGIFPECRIYYTPAPAFMWRLDDEWIGLTPEKVEEACKEIAQSKGLQPRFYAHRILKEAKRWAKIAGRVGWVLPRLETEVPQ
jgi:hypothetical protein